MSHDNKLPDNFSGFDAGKAQRYLSGLADPHILMGRIVRDKRLRLRQAKESAELLRWIDNFSGFDAGKAQRYLSGLADPHFLMGRIVRDKKLRLRQAKESAELLRWIAGYGTLPGIDRANARIGAAHTMMNAGSWADSLADIEATLTILLEWEKLPENLKGIRGNRVHLLYSFVSVAWQSYLLNGRSVEAVQTLSIGRDFLLSLDSGDLEKRFFLQTSQGVFRVLAAHSAFAICAGEMQEVKTNRQATERSFFLALRAAGQREISEKAAKEFLASVGSCVALRGIKALEPQEHPDIRARTRLAEELLVSAVRTPSDLVRNACLSGFRQADPRFFSNGAGFEKFVRLRSSLGLLAGQPKN